VFIGIPPPEQFLPDISLVIGFTVFAVLDSIQFACLIFTDAGSLNFVSAGFLHTGTSGRPYHHGPQQHRSNQSGEIRLFHDKTPFK
jgi:hypothetical protein